MDLQLVKERGVGGHYLTEKGEFCIKTDEFCIKTAAFVLKLFYELLKEFGDAMPVAEAWGLGYLQRRKGGPFA